MKMKQLLTFVIFLSLSCAVKDESPAAAAETFVNFKKDGVTISLTDYCQTFHTVATGKSFIQSTANGSTEYQQLGQAELQWSDTKTTGTKTSGIFAWDTPTGAKTYLSNAAHSFEITTYGTWPPATDTVIVTVDYLVSGSSTSTFTMVNTADATDTFSATELQFQCILPFASNIR